MNRLVYPAINVILGAIVLWGAFTKSIPDQIRYVLIATMYVIIVIQVYTVWRTSSECEPK